jgi:hypothetical protein
MAHLIERLLDRSIYYSRIDSGILGHINYYYVLYQKIKTMLQTKKLFSYTVCPKNGVLTVHYGVEETTVNVRKMSKKFYWT